VLAGIEDKESVRSLSLAARSFGVQLHDSAPAYKLRKASSSEV